jgi:hypothetical protein
MLMLEVIVKKLLLAVVAVLVLSMSFMFSGCAKHSSISSSSPLVFLSSKVHNWSRIRKVNPKEFSKYKRFCNDDNLAHYHHYIYNHYKRLQRRNIYDNCGGIAHILLLQEFGK